MNFQGIPSFFFKKHIIKSCIEIIIPLQKEKHSRKKKKNLFTRLNDVIFEKKRRCALKVHIFLLFLQT